MMRIDFKQYREAPEGFIQFCNDLVYVPIYAPGETVADWYPIGELPEEPNPATGKSYADIWKAQQEIARQCLITENGRFKYRLIIFCWMRGEGKSLMACLIQLWKFFCWPKQSIMLGANSKDQVKFVHYDIIRDIIYNSPDLFARVGKKNIQEKEIHLKDSRGKVLSLIRSISSFSGIVSNITGFTFSEIFDMKNPKFYVQLYGSTRNMPNALGVIDSTVSDKQHVLYQLYNSFIEQKTKEVFFSYRCSREGHAEDFWNPNMDETQLNDYRVTFPFGEFERYFLNLWSAGQARVFTDEMIEEIGIVGIDGHFLQHQEIKENLIQKNKLLASKIDIEGRGMFDGAIELEKRIYEIEKRFKTVQDLYSMTDRHYPVPRFPTMQEIENLSILFDTDFALLVGIDMADPMAVRSNARTIMTFMLKGLVGSRSNPYVYNQEQGSPEYIYFLLYAADIDDHSMERMKAILEAVHIEYDGIDMICGERFGIWDLQPWSEEREIGFEAIYPTYDRQRGAFKELFNVVEKGRLKSPSVPIHGSKKEDILREEASVFDHDTDKRWFGSPEKAEKYGVQDDFIYSLGWCMYGGRMLGPDEFRPRKAERFFGSFTPDKTLVGNY